MSIRCRRSRSSSTTSIDGPLIRNPCCPGAARDRWPGSLRVFLRFVEAVLRVLPPAFEAPLFKRLPPPVVELPLKFGDLSSQPIDGRDIGWARSMASGSGSVGAVGGGAGGFPAQQRHQQGHGIPPGVSSQRREHEIGELSWSGTWRVLCARQPCSAEASTGNARHRVANRADAVRPDGQDELTGDCQSEADAGDGVNDVELR